MSRPGDQMEIVEELKFMADMSDDLGEPGDGATYVRALAEIRKLRAALDACESILRYCPTISTNCLGTKPNMTTALALSMARAALPATAKVPA